MKEYRFDSKTVITARLVYTIIILAAAAGFAFILTRPMDEVGTPLLIISFVVFIIIVFAFGKLFIQINKRYVVLNGNTLTFYNGKKVSSEFNVLTTSFNLSSDYALEVTDENGKGYLFESTVTGGKGNEIFADINALKNL